MNNPRLKSVVLVTVLALVVVGVSLFVLGREPSPSPTPSPASSPATSSAIGPVATFAAATTQPKIAWSTTSINVILSPGESTSSDVTFTSSSNLTNVVLEVVPSIGPFVTIQPNTFDSVLAGQPQSVHISFSIASATAFGTYEGPIHLRLGSQTIPQTLKVTTNVWQSLNRPELHFSIKYPPGWTVQEHEQAVTFSNVAVSAPISTTSLQTQSFFEVRLLPQGNPGALPVLQWFDKYFSQGFAVAPLSKTALTLGGHPAVQLQTSEIGRRVHVYLSLDTDILEISYGLFAPAFISDYEGMLQTVEVN